MKRASIFSLYLLSFSLILISCEQKLPNVTTIVTGKVVDEQGKPVEGVVFQLNGLKKKGISPIPTFDAYSTTDSTGRFEIAHLITKETEQVYLDPASSTLYDLQRDYIFFYVLDDGSTSRVTASLRIPSDRYGKTTTVNYLMRKR